MELCEERARDRAVLGTCEASLSLLSLLDYPSSERELLSSLNYITICSYFENNVVDTLTNWAYIQYRQTIVV